MGLATHGVQREETEPAKEFEKEGPGAWEACVNKEPPPPTAPAAKHQEEGDWRVAESLGSAEDRGLVGELETEWKERLRGWGVLSPS